MSWLGWWTPRCSPQKCNCAQYSVQFLVPYTDWHALLSANMYLNLLDSAPVIEHFASRTASGAWTRRADGVEGGAIRVPRADRLRLRPLCRPPAPADRHAVCVRLVPLRRPRRLTRLCLVGLEDQSWPATALRHRESACRPSHTQDGVYWTTFLWF